MYPPPANVADVAVQLIVDVPALNVRLEPLNVMGAADGDVSVEAPSEIVLVFVPVLVYKLIW